MQLRSRGSWGSMRRFLPWLLMALLVSCGGGGGGGTPGIAPVTPSVTISSFTASKSTITAGTGTTLTAVFGDATGASVDHHPSRSMHQLIPAAVPCPAAHRS